MVGLLEGSSIGLFYFDFCVSGLCHMCVSVFQYPSVTDVQPVTSTYSFIE